MTTLQKFLSSRNLPTSTCSRSELIKLAEEVRSQDRRHGIMHVRDPENELTRTKWMLDTGELDLRDAPQYDERLKPPARDDDTAWVSGARLIHQLA